MGEGANQENWASCGNYGFTTKHFYNFARVQIRGKPSFFNLDCIYGDPQGYIPQNEKRPK